MKIAIQKNHLVGQILYRSLVPSKKRRHCHVCAAGYPGLSNHDFSDNESDIDEFGVDSRDASDAVFFILPGNFRWQNIDF